MKPFRAVLYTNDVLYEKANKDLANSSLATQKCLKYLEELFDISHCWARCFRNNQLVRPLNPKNYVEAQLLVVKDTIRRRQTTSVKYYPAVG